MRPSTPLLQSTPILLRDFIWHSLYHPTQGYFANQAPVVGFLEPPINFSALAGRRAYLEEVQRRYAQLQVSWLTPVEIFSPHVGATLARYMLEQALQQPSFASNSWSFASSMENNLRIYEIGGGTGTLALDVLSWLRHHHPRAYSQCHYTSLEISPSLAQLQKNRLRAAGHDEQRFRVQLGDAASPSTWVGPSEEPCFILAMEVLDNLPHDRCVNTKSGIADGSVWHETVISTVFEDTNVQRSDAAVYKEGLMPVRDPLIARCLDGYVDLYEASELKVASFRSIGSLVGNAVRRLVDASLQLEKTIFLPTGAMRLFDTLHAMRPSHTLICADFDDLPETRIHGWNAPLVATTRDGVAQDHSTYLVPPGKADIFFPSDFELLRRLYEEASHRSSRSVSGKRSAVSTRPRAMHMKAREFFERWAVQGTRTVDGYDPLLEDYTNTAILITQ